MKNIKERFQNLYEISKKSVQKFPLTIITIMFISILFVLELKFTYDIMKYILLFGFIFASATFLIETLLPNNFKKRIIWYILSTIPAFIAVYLTKNYSTLLDIISERTFFLIYRVYIFYIITIYTLTVYFSYKQSKISFEKYVTNVFSNVFKLSIIYGILSIGVLIVMAVFVLLILDGDNYSLIFKAEILIIGFYYLPTLIYSFSNNEENHSNFIKNVIKYVLGTLVISAFAIIYMYIIKILISVSMPSNQIFRILTALFICGLPIWTMISSFKEDKFIDKINIILPFLFIPFIFLQIYSMVVRISEYGITLPRYLCIIFVIFEVIYILMYLKRREKISGILFVFIGLTFITLLAPAINFLSVSEHSQLNRLKVYNEKTELSEDDKKEIFGAYNYLRNLPNGKELIEKNLTKEDIKIISDFSETSYYDGLTTKDYFSCYSYKRNFDISGYNYLYRVRSYENDIDDSLENVFSNIELTTIDDDYTTNVNIVDTIKEYIKYDQSDSLDTVFDNVSYIIIDQNKKLLFENISVTYDNITNEIESYSLDGILLVK